LDERQRNSFEVNGQALSPVRFLFALSGRRASSCGIAHHFASYESYNVYKADNTERLELAGGGGGDEFGERFHGCAVVRWSGAAMVCDARRTGFAGRREHTAARGWGMRC
jgi:hypothetical protein